MPLASVILSWYKTGLKSLLRDSISHSICWIRCFFQPLPSSQSVTNPSPGTTKPALLKNTFLAEKRDLLLTVFLLVLGLIYSVRGNEFGRAIGNERAVAFAEGFKKLVQEPYDQSVAKLRTSYAQALDKALKRLSSAGRLDESLALQKEINNITAGLEPPAADQEGTVPEIAILRQIWRKEMQVIDVERGKKASVFILAYDKLLANLEVDLTKATKLEDAQSIRKVREFIATKQPAAASPTPVMALPTGIVSEKNMTNNIPDTMRWNGLNAIEKTQDGLLLKSNPSEFPKLMSKAIYKPPFKLEVRFIPEDFETRIFFAEGQFIFGWNNDQSQVRIHSPLTFEPQAIKGNAPRSGKEYVVQAEFGLRKLTIKVNGRLIYTETADFSGLEGPISVGPNFGNKTTLTTFNVEVPESPATK